ncbi:hypothetical protein M9Y10_030849 [Tritrichomonas musculus]|uniref:Oxysterol binding protein n=1 Tax=Tritrichomonas musculus TaxID=1915356 RepID=A0ABR2H260_9EUKA
MDLTQVKEAPHTNEPVGELEGRQYYNASYTEFPKHELKLTDSNYTRERTVAINCNSKDGVKPMSKEEQAFERQLNWELVKRFTMAIFKMDVTRFSFPVGYNEPRTFVERATDLFSFLVTGYIDKAIEQTDPQLRLAYLATGIIAGFHLYLQQKKPWNPLLGETYVGEWPDGTRMFGEQTCHHPPVSDMQIIPPNDNWKINAQFNFAIDPGVTKVVILQKGRTCLDLKDGTHIEWEFPNIAVTGILTGDRVITIAGPFIMHDTTNNLEVHITVNPSYFEDRRFKGVQQDFLKMTPEQVEELMKRVETEEKAADGSTPESATKANPTRYRVTSVQGGVRTTGQTNFTTLIHGDYCDQVFINNKKAWDIKSDLTSRPLKEIPDADLLPSDCRFRIDRGMLIDEKNDEAETAKTLIEELQRHDYKLRESVPLEQ